MGYLNNAGLSYLYGKLKGLFGASLSVSGKTISLKSKDGTTLSSITTADASTYTTISLAATSWSSMRQTVTVSGVSSNNLILVEPLDTNYGIVATSQATNSITFSCEQTPTVAVSVKIAIIN